jgi:hypothetical protein
MATTYTHANFSVVDENHDVNVIYPQNTGIDVSIDRSQNATIPNDVSNAQQLANRLAATAFATNISDSTKSANTTWSSNKIDSELSQLSSDLRGGYSGTMKDLADNSGGSGVDIDDTITDTDSIWSSTKINSEINICNANLRGGYNGNMSDILNLIDARNKFPLIDLIPRCILTVDNEDVYSEFGDITLADLHELINSRSWNRYIKNGDYINLITKNGDRFQMIFNIDTYYDSINNNDNNNDDYSTIGTHHIDMISQNLIPNATWKMRTSADNSGGYYSYDTAGCVKANLADYYTNNIPDVLKQYIIGKKMVVPYRKSGAKYDSSNVLRTLPELWIPYYKETGAATANTPASSYENTMIEYPVLNINRYAKIKLDIENPTFYSWWTASAGSEYTSNWRTIYSGGYQSDVDASYGTATSTNQTNRLIGVPLCFRFV